MFERRARLFFIVEYMRGRSLISVPESFFLIFNFQQRWNGTPSSPIPDLLFPFLLLYQAVVKNKRPFEQRELTFCDSGYSRFTCPPLWVPLSESPSLSPPLWVPLSESPSLSPPLCVPLSESPSLSPPLCVSLFVSPSLSPPLCVPLFVSPSLCLLFVSPSLCLPLYVSLFVSFSLSPFFLSHYVI